MSEDYKSGMNDVRGKKNRREVAPNGASFRRRAGKTRGGLTRPRADRAKGAAEEERKCIYLRNQGSAGLAYAISDSRATSRTHRIGVLTDRFIFARTTINLRDERAPKSIADACATSSLVLTPILSHTCCLFPPSSRVSPSRLSRIIISLRLSSYSLLRIPARYDRTSRIPDPSSYVADFASW